jgi:hypothetical protein
MALRKPFVMSSEGFHEELSTGDTLSVPAITLDSGGDITLSGGGELLGLPSTPSSTGAASKEYVDAVVQGLDLHESVVVRANANVSIATPGSSIDSVSMTSGDRFLADTQTDPTEDGLYVWNGAAVAATRATDWPVGYSAAGAFVFVEEGTDADSGFVCTNDGGADVTGTDDLAFSQFSGAGQITAGTGLTKTGNTINAIGGNGITANANDLAVNPDSTTGGNIQPVNVAANGVGVDINAIAGTGLEADGSANLRIAAAAAGDGLSGGAGSALAINLEASNPSLQIVTDELGVKFNSSGGLEKLAAGTGIKLNGSTLLLGASGLSVKGLPSLFEIDGVAVSANVTATNLNTLTGSSNADALHTHATGSATEAPKIEENYTTATDATSVGDPVYVNGNDTVGKADAAVDAKSRLLGVIRTGAGAAGATPSVVTAGPCADVLAGATANTPYYLQAGGGIGTSLPTAGSRVICVGYALNATDLFVRLVDYGKSAA